MLRKIQELSKLLPKSRAGGVSWKDNDHFRFAWGHGSLWFGVDVTGKITDLALTDLGFTDEDIADWSKLPPTLKHLCLSGNQLRNFNGLPQGLKRLILRDNGLYTLDATSLPPQLQYLDLRDNLLERIDLSSMTGPLTVELRRNWPSMVNYTSTMSVEGVGEPLNQQHFYEQVRLDFRNNISVTVDNV